MTTVTKRGKEWEVRLDQKIFTWTYSSRSPHMVGPNKTVDEINEWCYNMFGRGGRRYCWRKTN
jgi:hypothetical protein